MLSGAARYAVTDDPLKAVEILVRGLIGYCGLPLSAGEKRAVENSNRAF